MGVKGEKGARAAWQAVLQACEKQKSMTSLFFPGSGQAGFPFFSWLSFFFLDLGPGPFFPWLSFFFLDLGPGRPGRTCTLRPAGTLTKAPQGPKKWTRGPAGPEKIGQKAPQGPKNGAKGPAGPEK